jgi:hypothetical protein
MEGGTTQEKRIRHANQEVDVEVGPSSRKLQKSMIFIILLV